MNPVDDFARYAAACQAVGRGGISAERVHELASGEDGIGLAALQADVAALTSAAADAQAALSAQRTAVGLLAGAWQGRSASAATDLLDRHCATAAGTAAALAEAADVLERLRERLARLLAERQEAGVRIADRRSAERRWWLACSDAVLAGTADGAAHTEVSTRIAQFVDADIAGDWAASVTAVTDAVGAAYRDAATVLAARTKAGFEVPSGAVRSPAPAPMARPLGSISAGAISAAAPAWAPALPGSAVPGVSPTAAPEVPGWGPAATFTSGPGGAARELPVGPVTDHARAGLPLDEIPDRAGDATEAEAEPEAEPEPEPAPEPEPDTDTDTDTDAGSDAEPGGPSSDTAQAAGEPAAPSAPGAAPEAAPDAAFGVPPDPVSAPGPLAAESGGGESGGGESGDGEPGDGERTPCEIAADALPQIGP